MNATFDGRFFVCPEGTEDWQDGYRDAMFHEARGWGDMLVSLVEENNVSGEYATGYVQARQDIADWREASRVCTCFGAADEESPRHRPSCYRY